MGPDVDWRRAKAIPSTLASDSLCRFPLYSWTLSSPFPRLKFLDWIQLFLLWLRGMAIFMAFLAISGRGSLRIWTIIIVAIIIIIVVENKPRETEGKGIDLFFHRADNMLCATQCVCVWATDKSTTSTGPETAPSISFTRAVIGVSLSLSLSQLFFLFGFPLSPFFRLILLHTYTHRDLVVFFLYV